MSNDVTPEENYETFIAVALSFAEIMADGAKSNGLNVSTSDVARKIAEDSLKKTMGKLRLTVSRRANSENREERAGLP